MIHLDYSQVLLFKLLQDYPVSSSLSPGLNEETSENGELFNEKNF